MDTINIPAVREWSDGLRDPRLRQGTGALTTIDGGKIYQCCLGVACDLFRNRITETVRVFEFGDSVRVMYDGNDGTLPHSIMKFLGFEYSNPTITLPLSEKAKKRAYQDGKSAMFTMAELNDSGFTFNQIADVIDYFFVNGE